MLPLYEQFAIILKSDLARKIFQKIAPRDIIKPDIMRWTISKSAIHQEFNRRVKKYL